GLLALVGGLRPEGEGGEVDRVVVGLVAGGCVRGGGGHPVVSRASRRGGQCCSDRASVGQASHAPRISSSRPSGTSVRCRVSDPHGPALPGRRRARTITCMTLWTRAASRFRWYPGVTAHTPHPVVGSTFSGRTRRWACRDGGSRRGVLGPRPVRDEALQHAQR